MTERADPRDIPVLHDVVEDGTLPPASYDVRSLHAALLAEILELSDSLLHQAVKDIEATLLERVRDQLKTELPELVDRILREQVLVIQTAGEDG